MATPAEIHARLVSVVGEAVLGYTPAVEKTAEGKDPGGARDACAAVDPARLHEVALALRDDDALRFDFLQCITAVDWPKQSRIELVYHLWSYAHRHAFCVKALVPREAPVLASVADVWASAEWGEREQFDLLGVRFEGHPDLRRVLLPDDWVGHPMRKDWQEPARYRDMATSRPSPLDLLAAFDRASDDEKRHLPIVGAEEKAAGGSG